MAKADQIVVLVEHTHTQPHPIAGFKGGDMVRIVRTYLSEKRAQEDLSLLLELNPDANFLLHHVDHIDD